MSDSIITQRCTKCKKVKDTSKFHKNERYAGGYHSWCKQCQRDNARTHAKKRKQDQLREWDFNGKECRRCHNIRSLSDFRTVKCSTCTPCKRSARKRALLKYNHTQKRYDCLRAYGTTSKRQDCLSRYKVSHWDRMLARAAVNYAVSAGHIPNAKDCTCNCGKDAEEYHHHKGYAKKNRLDIIALCMGCHGRAG